MMQEVSCGEAREDFWQPIVQNSEQWVFSHAMKWLIEDEITAFVKYEWKAWK